MISKINGVQTENEPMTEARAGQDGLVAKQLLRAKKEETAVADQEMLAFMFADLAEVVAKASKILSPYDAHMASFHLGLLEREFLRKGAPAEPSADIIMMAGTWLQNRVPGLAPVLGRLWLSVAAKKIVARAGYSLEFWLNARLSNYNVEGNWLDLKRLHESLQAVASEEMLLLLCHALAFNYGELYCVSTVEKAQELMALCVRHGRVHELNRLLQLKKNTAVA